MQMFALVKNGKVVGDAPFDGKNKEEAAREAMNTMAISCVEFLKGLGYALIPLTPELEAQYPKAE